MKDLVIIAGDLINYKLKPVYHLKEYLFKLNKPIVCVLGNHDYYAKQSKIVKQVISTIPNLKILGNEVYYPFGNESFAIVGIEDLLEGNFNPSIPFNNILNNKLLDH